MTMDQALETYRESFRWIQWTIKISHRSSLGMERDYYDLLVSMWALFASKKLPLIYVTDDVLKIVKTAADQLDFGAVSGPKSGPEIWNPLTKQRGQARYYRPPDNSNLPTLNYTMFEHPISLGHVELISHGVVTFAYQTPEGPVVGLRFGVYDRDVVAKVEHTEHLLNRQTAPRWWLAPVDETEIESVTKLDYALHQFSSQRLIQTRPESPTRSARRRWAKEMKPPIPEIVYVRLRKVLRRTKGGEEGKVDWSHRWLVHGFWRNQWYRSTQDHRPVWIAPYVKGPEDKPLVLKDRVIEVSR